MHEAIELEVKFALLRPWLCNVAHLYPIMWLCRKQQLVHSHLIISQTHSWSLEHLVQNPCLSITPVWPIPGKNCWAKPLKCDILKLAGL